MRSQGFTTHSPTSSESIVFDWWCRGLVVVARVASLACFLYSARDNTGHDVLYSVHAMLPVRGVVTVVGVLRALAVLLLCRAFACRKSSDLHMPLADSTCVTRVSFVKFCHPVYFCRALAEPLGIVLCGYVRQKDYSGPNHFGP
eukprot:3822284-Amphidinium_carterae.1